MKPLLLASILIAMSAVAPACGPTAAAAPASAAPEPGGAAPATVDLDAQPAVPNPEAKPGDVTDCPYSGRKFVVKADSPTFDYGGKTWVFCSEKARDAVAADPQRYLGPPDDS